MPNAQTEEGGTAAAGSAAAGSAAADSAAAEPAGGDAAAPAGRVERLWIKRAKLGPMDPVREVQLDEHGIVGNANRGGQRQITLIEREVWARHMAALGGDLDPARRRANILLSGCELEGARNRVLRIGDCRLRIRGETKPCERMEEALTGLREEMFPRWGGGAFGVVVTSGTIREGDVVSWDDAP